MTLFDQSRAQISSTLLPSCLLSGLKMKLKSSERIKTKKQTQRSSRLRFTCQLCQAFNNLTNIDFSYVINNRKIKQETKLIPDLLRASLTLSLVVIHPIFFLNKPTPHQCLHTYSRKYPFIHKTNEAFMNFTHPTVRSFSSPKVAVKQIHPS